jgi:hypothetical protein
MQTAILLLLLVALVLLFFCLFPKRDMFSIFGSSTGISISWVAPDYGATINDYQVAVCMGDATTCSTDPSTWSIQIDQATDSRYNWNVSSTVCTMQLNTTNCPGCDLGGSMMVAVRGLDTTNNVIGPWAVISSMNLSGQVTDTGVVWLDTYNNNLAPGATGYTINIPLSAIPTPRIANPPASYWMGLYYIYITRGSTVYSLADNPSTFTYPIAQDQTNGQTLTLKGAFSAMSNNPPDNQLDPNDIVTIVAVLLENPQSVGAYGLTPPNTIFYYGQHSIQMGSMGAPSNLTYIIA